MKEPNSITVPRLFCLFALARGINPSVVGKVHDFLVNTMRADALNTAVEPETAAPCGPGSMALFLCDYIEGIRPSVLPLWFSNNEGRLIEAATI